MGLVCNTNADWAEATTAITDLDNVTIVGWSKPSTDNMNLPLFVTENTVAPQHYFQIGTSDTGQTPPLRFFFIVSDSSAVTSETTRTDTQNQWNFLHAEMITSGATKTWRMGRNGVWDTTPASADKTLIFAVPSTKVGAKALFSHGGDADYAELAVFSGVLSSQNIIDLNGGASPFDLDTSSTGAVLLNHWRMLNDGTDLVGGNSLNLRMYSFIPRCGSIQIESITTY